MAGTESFWTLSEPNHAAVTLTAGLLVTLCMLWWWTSLRSSPSLPPGPRPALPLLGHIHLLKKDPREQFKDWRQRYGDVFSFYLGSQAVVVVNGYRVIREALVVRADSLSHRPHNAVLRMVGISGGIVNSSGPGWKALRTTGLAILREMGMGKNLLAQKVQEEVREYVKAVQSFHGRPRDLTTLTLATISNNICSIIFGRRFEYEDENFKRSMATMDEYFKNSAASGASNFMPWLRFLPGDFFLFRKRMELIRYLKEIFVKPEIDTHMRNYDENDIGDFISAYIREMRSEKKKKLSQYLNETNLRTIILELFAAGTDTTSTTILWTLAYFLHYPQVQEKCFQEVLEVIGTERMPAMTDRARMTYLEATIMEVLRHADIVPLSVAHAAAEDVQFEGYLIPKGCVVLVHLDTALRDPEGWTEPDLFRPERFISEVGTLVKPDQFIPFSTGRRVCLGESLARMELFLYLSTMIQRFRFLPPEDGQLPSLQGVMGLTKSPGPFQVRAVPRDVD